MKLRSGILMSVVTASLIASFVIAQPVPPPGLRVVTHDSTLKGSGTVATPLGLALCGSSGIWKMNGSATGWGCGSDAVNTGTVTSVGSGSGISGGPITSSGNLAIDPTYTQRRVSGTCATPNGVTTVNQDGTVSCTTGVVDTAGTSLWKSGSTLNLGITPVTCATGSGVSAIGSNGAATCVSNGFNGSASSTLNMNAHAIIGVLAPTNGSDAVNKTYADAHSIGGAGSGASQVIPMWTGSNTLNQSSMVQGSVGLIFIAGVQNGTSVGAGTGMNLENLSGTNNTWQTLSFSNQFGDSGSIGMQTLDTGTGVSVMHVYTVGSDGELNRMSLGSGGAAFTVPLHQTTIVDDVTVDNTTFAAAFAFVNNYAFPASTRTVILGAAGVGGGALVTGIVAPTVNYQRISIINNGTQCLLVYDDNTNSTITNRIKLEVAATGSLYVCKGGSLDCIYDPNVGSVTPGRWSCAITWAQDSPGPLTVDGGLNIAGTVTSNNWITSGNSIYAGGGPAAEYMSSGVGGIGHTASLNCGYSNNAASTCYIDTDGYAESSTQPRSLWIQDGQGSSSAHTIASFDGTNRVATFANQPIGGEGAYTGKHIEGADEWMSAPAGLTGGPIPISSYALATAGAGAGTVSHTNVAGRPGLISLASGAGASLTELVGDSSSVNFGDGKWSYNAILAWPTLSGSAAAGNEYITITGFWDTSSGNQVDGCYFNYDHGNVSTSGPNASKVNNLSCWCVSNSVRTAYLMAGTGTGSAGDGSFALGSAAVVAGTYINLLVTVDQSIPEADFTVNGTKMCQIKTNIPTGVTRVTDYGIIMIDIATSAFVNEQVDIDWTKWALDLTSARSP